MDLTGLLEAMISEGASDLHLQAGSPPMLRLGGQLTNVEDQPMSDDQIRDLMRQMAYEDAQVRLEDHRAADFSFEMPNRARFRVNAFYERDRLSMALRLIPIEVPPFEELNLPSAIEEIAQTPRGLILVTGTTGSGKSTTLAAMIDYINTHRGDRIITIEDPIEFVHKSKKSLIAQRELGTDTPSFLEALRASLRQDPDVILIGELRDVNTLRIALRAADTGHQVFSTVHSANAPQTIERIIAMFPPAEHKLLLQQLAGSTEAIISQRLVRTLKGGRRPAVEILRGSPVTEKFILENKVHELGEYVQSGESGMQSFNDHLLAMYREQIISGTEALRWASNAEALAMGMRGIKQPK